jgi:Tol biopolymer transport system component
MLAGCGGSSQGTLAFTSTRDGNAEVYVMRADGTHVEDLTQNLAQDGEPSWSPDGKKLAFISTRAGNAQIYVMNADGSGQRRVTHSNTGDMAPVWSPDGRKLAYMCTIASPFLVTEICVVNADSSGQRRLTRPSEKDNLYPVWSGDGSSILFTSMRPGYGIYAVSPKGGGERLVVRGGAEAALSSGTVAYLSRSQARGKWGLYVGSRRVTGADTNVDSPAWSPAGDTLAFVEADAVHVVAADGSGERRLTSGPGNSLSPRWSPDGKSIAFERVRGQHSDVYVVRADGSGEQSLTQGDGKNGGPVWRP